MILAGEQEGEGVLEAIQVQILKVLQHQAPYAHELEGIDSIMDRFEMGGSISKEAQDPVSFAQTNHSVRLIQTNKLYTSCRIA